MTFKPSFPIKQHSCAPAACLSAGSEKSHLINCRKSHPVSLRAVCFPGSEWSLRTCQKQLLMRRRELTIVGLMVMCPTPSRHFRVTFHISLNLAHSFMRSELIFVIKENTTGEVTHVWERTYQYGEASGFSPWQHHSGIPSATITVITAINEVKKTEA